VLRRHGGDDSKHLRHISDAAEQARLLVVVFDGFEQDPLRGGGDPALAARRREVGDDAAAFESEDAIDRVLAFERAGLRVDDFASLAPDVAQGRSVSDRDVGILAPHLDRLQ